MIYKLSNLIKRTYKKVYVGDAETVNKGFNRGLFCARPIKKGEVAFIANGERYRENVTTLEASMNHRDAIGLTPDTWLDPFQNNPLRYINHSCNPNLGIKGQVSFVALRNIKKDEHLTIDYSITECDKLWNFKIQTGGNCLCGEKNCRKVIKSIQFLPLETYKKYLPYIPKAFQRVYNEAHT
jgi:uncharacterized protein